MADGDDTETTEDTSTEDTRDENDLPTDGGDGGNASSGHTGTDAIETIAAEAEAGFTPSGQQRAALETADAAEDYELDPKATIAVAQALLAMGKATTDEERVAAEIALQLALATGFSVLGNGLTAADIVKAGEGGDSGGSAGAGRPASEAKSAPVPAKSTSPLAVATSTTAEGELLQQVIEKYAFVVTPDLPDEPTPSMFQAPPAVPPSPNGPPAPPAPPGPTYQTPPPGSQLHLEQRLIDCYNGTAECRDTDPGAYRLYQQRYQEKKISELRRRADAAGGTIRDVETSEMVNAAAQLFLLFLPGLQAFGKWTGAPGAAVAEAELAARTEGVVGAGQASGAGEGIEIKGPPDLTGADAAAHDLAAIEEGSEVAPGTLSSAAASSDGTIAAHSESHWPNLTREEILAKIQQVRETGTAIPAPNGNTFTYLRDGTILIEDSTSLDGGTLFRRTTGKMSNYINAWLDQNR